ncbi:hypothetical protein D3C87_1264460 [compost metagenome]
MKRWTQLKMIVLITTFASVANAQSVSFQNISDSVLGRNYDPATSIADSANPNKLLIGIHSGYDPKSWTNLAFLASTGGFATTKTHDSLSVDIVAPPGYGISQIIYRQTIQASKTRIASYSSTISWTVDGLKQAVSALTSGIKTSTAQFSAPRTVVRVQLDSALSATNRVYLSPTRYATAGSAGIMILSPSLEAKLVPMP